MSIFDLFWLFFILAAVQPLIRQRVQEARRFMTIDKMQKARHSRVILLVHRQETMRLLGFPLMRFIDVNDSEEVLRAIRMTDDDVPIDLVLHTPGGLVLAALQIARALRAHPARVTVFVPHHALSGGTLIALAADAVVMSDHAVLGPVDPQLGQWPAASIVKVVEDKPIAEIDDETLIRADMGRKALAQVKSAAADLLAKHMDADKAAELADLLSSGTWTHDYPIAAEEAARMGLPVTRDMPADVLDLLRLYPQPVRHTGGVEYLPTPRERDRAG
ncbi:SDH family Clp fold serine proteinase [Rhodovulum sp. YNF3179]|uniref:SDH family Clp fold serine proteinase n=1 Tax=Rhodovulum sp. YNF3179 TaxID=3425127 RepID=UPI003D3325CA